MSVASYPQIHPSSAVIALPELPRETPHEPQPDEHQRTPVHAMVARQIDHLLELGRLLVRLAETAIEEESNTRGGLPGAFRATRLPLQLKEVEMNLTALQAIDVEAPAGIVRLVAEPGLFKQGVSAIVINALDEINDAIRRVAPTPVAPTPVAPALA